MRTIIALAVFCSFVSCSTTRETGPHPILKKGCNIDSVRKYSEVFFKKAAKKQGEPEGTYETLVYERDSLIIVQHTPVVGLRGGFTYKILKRTCTVIDVESYH